MSYINDISEYDETCSDCGQYGQHSEIACQRKVRAARLLDKVEEIILEKRNE